MQCRKDRKRLAELFQTERFQDLNRETEEVIAEHLQIKELTRKMEKEGMTMCQAYEDLKKEWLQEGKEEGKKDEKMEIICRMLKEGLDEVLIRRMTKCTKEELAAAAGR